MEARVCMFFKTSATCGAGTAYHSGASEFTPVFSRVLVTQSLIFLQCFADICLFLRRHSFGHCIGLAFFD